jgi:hypothetical protein
MTLQQVMDASRSPQHGSLHAAARATGQTQPALTKSLRRLEADLGAPLFERHARGVRPPTSAAASSCMRSAWRPRPAARDAMAQMLGDRRGSVVYGISAAASHPAGAAGDRASGATSRAVSCTAAAACTTRWRRRCATAGSTSCLPAAARHARPAAAGASR